ncbi:MAG: DNA alkylation repair protein [Kordiimonas sp.]
MAEPFKEWMNLQLVETTADIFSRVYKGFDRTAFLELASNGLTDLELKARAQHITHALDRYLPHDFDEFAEIALAALHPSENPSAEGFEFGPEGLMSFAAWPLTDLVTARGINIPEKALPLLKEVTKRFTAEFAIRPFLDKHTEYTLKVLESWLTDESQHVRRLVSEGTRPRLPWGMRLNKFVENPALIMPLLTVLKDDDEEYVRRSVANNLNDIAKDHPDLVSKTADAWLQGANKNRQRLVRHACRTLIKQGHEETLKAFGYVPLVGLQTQLNIETPVVDYGNTLEFSFDIKRGPSQQQLMVDYAVHFMKSNGLTSPKVFKWKDTKLDSAGQLNGAKKHPIKPITTRVYYPGEHLLEIFVNGVSVAQKPFMLRM